ncbi:MAG TPA: hypothetical protein VFR15_15120 [Chloroflexia bacterium]|nr:hypothetical protein [Chloroflexia bacterium]
MIGNAVRQAGPVRFAGLLCVLAFGAVLLSPGLATAGTPPDSPEAACPAGGQCFADVPEGNAFYEFANRLYQQDIISGYPCGGLGEPCDSENRPYYRPGANVTRQQMTKFVDQARRLPEIYIDTPSALRPVYSRTGATDGIALYGEATTGEGSIGVYGLGALGVRGESHGGAGVRGIGTCPSGLCLTAMGVYGSSTTGDGVRGSSTANNGRGVQGIANTGAGAVGVYGTSSSGDGVYGYSEAAGRFGVQGVSTGNGGTGVSGTANTGQNAAGVRGHSNSGTGVVGSTTASSESGVIGIANGTDGYGVEGSANTGTNAVGVYGRSNTGRGVYGASFANNGSGVYGASNTGTSASGVYGVSSSGYGVNGLSTAAEGIGVYGRANAADAVSVYGLTTNGIGVAGTSTNGDGVFGLSSGSRAGYFVGNVEVTGGCCAAGAGTYRIDHPLDPENRYLYHAAVESPDMKNIYDGVAVLDGSGEARVQLPEWFEALNRDFRYQLTAIGAPMSELYIADEISGNSFKIAGGVPGMKVSWQVTGIRHDPYAEQNRVPVEQDKPASERGTYQHPREWAQPESKGVSYEKVQKLQDRP